ncbi:hypothetical protein [Azohydromonas australica]|uniref:hypothetical protein n=1 Tax=Azohydromonas australica TaxID=364039 RepID=UPI00041998AE|nr:hypothetical protein [Azohydromonas australica]
MSRPDEAQPLPGVRDLLQQLRAGGVVSGHGHTLALADGMGPFVLHGTNPGGVSYYGSLSRGYVQWWRARLIAGQSIGETLPYVDLAESDAQSIGEVVDRFFGAFGTDAGPGAQLEVEPVPEVLGPWGRQVIAAQLVKLLDDERFSIWKVDSLGHAFRSIFPKMGRTWHLPRDHADYAALQVLHYDSYQKMDRAVAEGLPDAVLRVLDLDYPLLHELLADHAKMVIERFARGVVSPAPVPVVEVDLLMPKVAPESLTHPVSGWRRFFGVRSTPASRAG